MSEPKQIWRLANHKLDTLYTEKYKVTNRSFCNKYYVILN